MADDYYCASGVGDCAMSPNNSESFLALEKLGPANRPPEKGAYYPGDSFDWGENSDGHWWVCENCHYLLLSMYNAGVPLTPDGLYCIEEVPI